VEEVIQFMGVEGIFTAILMDQALAVLAVEMAQLLL
jgi:hypothetical protein